jgi:hypothetical protein
MAVGYSHVATVAALLEAGADPEVQDRQSRDVVALVQSIRGQMPVAPQFMGRRMALEQVTALLSGVRASRCARCLDGARSGSMAPLQSTRMQAASPATLPRDE